MCEVDVLGPAGVIPAKYDQPKEKKLAELLVDCNTMVVLVHTLNVPPLVAVRPLIVKPTLNCAIAPPEKSIKRATGNAILSR